MDVADGEEIDDQRLAFVDLDLKHFILPHAE